MLACGGGSGSIIYNVIMCAVSVSVVMSKCAVWWLSCLSFLTWKVETGLRYRKMENTHTQHNLPPPPLPLHSGWFTFVLVFCAKFGD